jgi:hypothetical protein
MARDFLGHVEHFEHRRALADNPMKAEVRKKLVLKLAHLRASREALGQLVQRLGKARVVDGFADEVMSAALHRVDGGIHRIFLRH